MSLYGYIKYDMEKTILYIDESSIQILYTIMYII